MVYEYFLPFLPLISFFLDITPQQFYELIPHQYETLFYIVAPNDLVLAVQRHQNHTRVLGGVCNMDDRTASMICDEHGYHYGGKVKCLFFDHHHEFLKMC